MKRISIIIFLTACFLTIPLFISEIFAQPPPPQPTDVGAPLDGGALMLLIGGAAYGVRKLMKKKKN